MVAELHPHHLKCKFLFKIDENVQYHFNHIVNFRKPHYVLTFKDAGNFFLNLDPLGRTLSTFLIT